MSNYFEKREEFNEGRKKYFQEKTNLRVKNIALVSIAISIILLLTMALGIVDISKNAMLFMRGCAGIFAIIFVVLVAILVYRVNVSYFKDKIDSNK